MWRIAAFNRLAIGTGLFTIFVVAELSLAKNHDDTKQGAVAIPVLVYNYTEVDDRTIAGAEKEAGRAFDRAGVTLIWHNCGSGEGPAVLDGACSPAASSPGIELRIVKSVRKVPRMADDNTLGFTFGQIATVCDGEAHKIASRASLSDEWVLGDAIAHELGHLFMPGHPHAPTGIMQASWRDEDRFLGRGHMLNFLPAQLALIRASAERMAAVKAAISIAHER